MSQKLIGCSVMVCGHGPYTIISQEEIGGRMQYYFIDNDGKKYCEVIEAIEIIEEKANAQNQDEIVAEIKKCGDNPYYFATKYIKGFHTSLTEEEFNKYVKLGPYHLQLKKRVRL